MPYLMMMRQPVLISSLDLFLAMMFLVLILESKSRLLMIWMVLLVSNILMLSLAVDMTIPM